MYEVRRQRAESALRMLLVGATFVGAHWYGTLLAVLARGAFAADGLPYEVTYSESHLMAREAMNRVGSPSGRICTNATSEGSR